LCRKQAWRVLKTIMHNNVDQWAVICIRTVGHNHAGILPLPMTSWRRRQGRGWGKTRTCDPKVADLKFNPTRASLVSVDAQKPWGTRRQRD
jgi:hypothetical protein